MSRVFGPAIDEAAGWAQESLASKRFLWRLRNLQRVADELYALGVDPQHIRTIPPRLGAPLLTGIADEDDETVQKVWARLISNAVDETQRFDLKKLHIEIIRNLDPAECLLLDRIGSHMTGDTPALSIRVADLAAETTLTVAHHCPGFLLIKSASGACGNECT